MARAKKPFPAYRLDPELCTRAKDAVAEAFSTIYERRVDDSTVVVHRDDLGPFLWGMELAGFVDVSISRLNPYWRRVTIAKTK